MNMPANATISAPKVLLQGEMGSGKTTSIRTLVELGYEVFVLATEPGIGDILGDIPPDKLHWCYVAPVNPSFKVVEDAAKLLNTTHYDVIQKMGGINKQNHQEFFKLMHAANNFTCDRTGQTFGDIATWGPNRVFVVDSLTGLTKLAIANVVGDKPFLEMRDYSAAHFLISNFVNTCCASTRAWFVLTAHLEREVDPSTGLIQLMVSTIGKALAPVLPRYFSDAILCRMVVKDGKPVFLWDTLSANAKVKTRNLPLAEGLPAGFKQLSDAWAKKVGYMPPGEIK